MLAPVVCLVADAAQAEPRQIWQTVWRWRNLELIWNTLTLGVAVLGMTTFIAIPVAWLTTRSDLPFKRLFTVALILPLAVPGYLIAYTLLSVSGRYGAAFVLTGVPLPRIDGFLGAMVALSLYQLPYLLLNLRAALLDLDCGLEEIARSLGHRPWHAFFTVVLPQLRPALYAGWLLVGLHVINDFGVVSLMGYPTLSFALYQKLEVLDGVGAAWVALMLLAAAGSLIGIEWWLLRRLRLHRVGTAVPAVAGVVALGIWRWPAMVFLLCLFVGSLFIPLATICYWATQADYGVLWLQLQTALMHSVGVGLPAAVAAVALAAPIAYLARRYSSKRSLFLERFAFVGYAVPALAFALGLVVATLAFARPLYQTVFILVYAYSLHFLAEAVAPLRAALFRASPRVEEAARSLGHGQLSTLVRVTLPLLRPGLVAAVSLVLLSCIKELPLTLVLAPPDFETLSTQVWKNTEDIRYAEAAPFAMLILVVASVSVFVLLRIERSP